MEINFIKKKLSGVTLVELIIVIALILILVTAMTGAFNPIAMVNKAKDSQRKKDVARIKVAFEEYFSDKGAYPDSGVVDQLMNKDNCGSRVFSPWLVPWPCDPNGNPYIIVVNQDPQWYKVMTNLENLSDDDIPIGWYSHTSSYRLGDGSYGHTQVNYGDSSTNVRWYEYVALPQCRDSCYMKSRSGNCQASVVTGCVEPNCYGDNNCTSTCALPCCGAGCNR